MNCVAVAGERANHVGLLAVEPAALQRRLDEVGACDRAVGATALAGSALEVALGLEDRSRRVSTVAVGALHGDGVFEQPVGVAVDFLASSAVEVRGGYSLNDVATIERRGVARQVVEPYLRGRARLVRSLEELANSCPVEAERGGALAPALAQLPGRDVVVLALARCERGGRRGGGRVLATLAHEPLDLLAARGELP